jgi:hypothetical protein
LLHDEAFGQPFNGELLFRPLRATEKWQKLDCYLHPARSGLACFASPYGAKTRMSRMILLSDNITDNLLVQ